MRILKRLHDAVKASRVQFLVNGVLNRDELDHAMTEAHEFLCSSKSFEYTGLLTIGNSGNVVRLKDINTDFDDIVRMLGGKRQDVSVPCQIFVLVVDENELKRRQEAAELQRRDKTAVEPETPET